MHIWGKYPEFPLYEGLEKEKPVRKLVIAVAVQGAVLAIGAVVFLSIGAGLV